MIEEYLTVITFLVILHKPLSFLYLKLGKKYTKLVKTDFYNLRLLFRDTKVKTRYYFLSTLWIFVYYFDFIKELLRGFING